MVLKLSCVLFLQDLDTVIFQNYMTKILIKKPVSITSSQITQLNKKNFFSICQRYFSAFRIYLAR